MNNGTAPNAKRLLWAGFFAIFAAGVGFSVRGGILVHWAREYGFTMSELGGITGGGLWGFGLVILFGSFLAEVVGYRVLIILALVMHLLSAILQLCTGYVYEAFGRDTTYWSLTIAMVMFAVANGICEAVVNPMVAALYPKEKTHYLNILHAGWPGGLIAGGLVSYFMNGGTIGSWMPLGQVPWVIQMSMFLIPTVIYGLMILGQKFPRSEAGASGVSLGTMLREFAAPVLLLLLFIHALVGYVELGTDSWISQITGSIMADPKKGLLLFVYTSALMFTLRFFAGPIVHKLSPLGLLMLSGILGCVGLTLLGSAVGPLMCVVAATVYALGKTFLWPTMLAIVSERFPRGGSLTIGAIGGVGMLSAGILGGPGIGFKQDYYASHHLEDHAPATYQRYVVPEEKTFLGVFKVRGLDGAKVGVLMDEGAELTRVEQLIAQTKSLGKGAQEHAKLAAWWTTAKEFAAQDKPAVQEAGLFGGRMALKWTAIVPAVMALLYFLLILYFKSQGGYKALHVSEEMAGGPVRGGAKA